MVMLYISMLHETGENSKQKLSIEARRMVGYPKIVEALECYWISGTNGLLPCGINGHFGCFRTKKFMGCTKSFSNGNGA